MSSKTRLDRNVNRRDFLKAGVAAGAFPVPALAKSKSPNEKLNVAVVGAGGSKGANWEGGIRVPGIVCWPGTVREGHVETEPAGLVDVLPTVCGLLGIAKPNDHHLDGSDLSPLLTERRKSFERHQPLFWLLANSYPVVAIHDDQLRLCFSAKLHTLADTIGVIGQLHIFVLFQ